MDIDYPIQNNIFNLMRAIIVEVIVLLFFLFFLLLFVLDSYANK